MIARYLFFSLVFLFSLNTISGQNYLEIAEKIALSKEPVSIKWDISRGSNCDPDSILFFGFETPNDSILGIRRVFHKYGDVSLAIHEYEFIDESGDLKLSTIDSTVFDMAGRPILNEFWEFDLDSNKLLLKERSHFYPYEGNVLKDYSFFDDMINEFNYWGGDFVDYDSVIVYRREFITGLLKPREKRVHLYSLNGYIEETLEYRFAEFDMSWFPVIKKEIYYTASNRIDRIEELTWDGIDDYILNFTSQYTYHSNDSLESVLRTNNLTDQPVERMEMFYNTSQNSIFSKVDRWDANTSQWVESISLYGEIDELNRIEVLDIRFNFFGDILELRYEYVYNGDEGCPFYIDAFEMDGGNWNFYGRIYFYPFIFTSTYDLPSLEWSAYPNPTYDGIWVEAPIGSQVQIATLLGNILYTGEITDEREFITLNQLNAQVILTIKNDSSSSSRLIIVNK